MDHEMTRNVADEQKETLERLLPELSLAQREFDSANAVQQLLYSRTGGQASPGGKLLHEMRTARKARIEKAERDIVQWLQTIN